LSKILVCTIPAATRQRKTF